MALRAGDFGFDFSNFFLGEAVDERELKTRRSGDFLDLVLAVDVGLEHQIPVERHWNGFPIAIKHLNVVTPRPLGPVPGPVLGLDLEIDRPAAEITAHMALDGLGAGPAVVHVRHHAENVADELEDRRLARPAAANDAVEAVAELEPRTVEKTSRHLDAQDAVVRVMAAILAL